MSGNHADSAGARWDPDELVTRETVSERPPAYPCTRQQTPKSAQWIPR